MAEANTEGLKGWTPTAEKKPEQKARRETVDSDIMGNVRRPFDSAKVRLEWKLDDMADAIEESGEAAASVPQVTKQVGRLMDVAAGIRKVGGAVGLGRLAGAVASVPEKIAKNKVDSTLLRGAKSQVRFTKVRGETIKAAERFRSVGEGYERWGGDKQIKEMTRNPRQAPNRHERRRLGKS